MKDRILLFLLFLPTCAHGYVTGDGGVELGVSGGINSHNYGVSTNYGLNSIEPSFRTSLLSKVQLGSDEGRSLVATAAQEYQYESSFVRTDIDNSIHFIYPGLLWQSRLSHNLEFEQESDTTNSERRTDFSKSTANWSVSTGPSFTYNRGKWLSYTVGLTLSQAFLSDEVSTEKSAFIGIGKRISPITSGYLDSTNICTDSGESGLNDSCRNEIRLSVISNRAGANLRLEYGISKQNDTRADLYLLSVEHQLNSYSTIELGFNKSIKSISEKNDINNSLTTNSATQDEQSFSYSFDWGRKQLEIKARTLSVTTGDESIKTKHGSIFYTYLLGSRACSSCSFKSSYEYTDYGYSRDQNIRSFGIMKTHSRRMSSTLSYRRTHLKNELDTWSVNLIFTYKGLLTKIGKR